MIGNFATREMLFPTVNDDVECDDCPLFVHPVDLQSLMRSCQLASGWMD